MIFLFSWGKGTTKTITYTEFWRMVEGGKIASVQVSSDGESFAIKDKANNQFRVYIPKGSDAVKILEKRGGIEIAAKPESSFFSFILAIIPYLFLLFIWLLLFRGTLFGGGRNLPFGKTKVKVYNPQGLGRVTFADVGGVDEAVEELKDVVTFLRNPQEFIRLGARMPKGVLLVGPPGTGKTLLARALAGEAGANFLSMDASDFVEIFVGMGASRVRELFDQARRTLPSIIFIDEIDAVARSRGTNLLLSHHEQEQTLQKILAEMDGFEQTAGIMVVAATNRPDVLDPALLRAGRFDRQVVVPRPDIKGREAILKIYLSKKVVALDVDPSIIARGTAGLVGADLDLLVNEAAIFAAKKAHPVITKEDMEAAADKVIMGPARKGLVLTPEVEKTIACHESGHALVAYLTKHADPVHKVTLVSHGQALGLTQQLPETDQYLYSKEQLLAQVRVLLGGRVAEELMCGTVTTGAQNDLERATQVVDHMVREFGMSDLGIMRYGKSLDSPFLIPGLTQPSDLSEDTKREVDQETRRILDMCYAEVQRILTSHRDILTRVIESLLREETIDGKRLAELVELPRGLY